MNIQKLKQAEAEFFARYPGGFDNPELIEIRKHHRLEKMFQLAQQSFAEKYFEQPELIVDNMMKIISQSSLISRFEKPTYRNFNHALLRQEKQRLSKALEAMLYGNQQNGFETLAGMLQTWKLAKWSLMTICQAYYHPQTEVFIKPTTTKNIIRYFELDHLHYYPTPTWAFYDHYRSTINEMKNKVDASLSPNSVAFTGFLMRMMPTLF
ncbi:MAG TPA: hypothetical protein VK909_17410 [Anaerolineales bacterium]|nr:hypothetical protein [Anaerolineales bacterium]